MTRGRREGSGGRRCGGPVTLAFVASRVAVRVLREGGLVVRRARSSGRRCGGSVARDGDGRLRSRSRGERTGRKIQYRTEFPAAPIQMLRRATVPQSAGRGSGVAAGGGDGGGRPGVGQDGLPRRVVYLGHLDDCVQELDIVRNLAGRLKEEGGGAAVSGSTGGAGREIGRGQMTIDHNTPA